MRARFHDEPMIQATELLLQERSPRDVAVVARPGAEEVRAATDEARADTSPIRRSGASNTPHDRDSARHASACRTGDTP